MFLQSAAFSAATSTAARAASAPRIGARRRAYTRSRCSIFRVADAPFPSLHPALRKKMNSHATALRERLANLRDDVRDVSVRARAHGVDIVIDPCATAAIESLYDAYASCIIRDAREALEARRASNTDAVRSLASGVQTFARAIRGFDGDSNTCTVWNLPSNVMRADMSRQTMKTRVLRRVELGVAERAAAATTSTARDEDVKREHTSLPSALSLLYACHELIYPRRVMTQCALLREASNSAQSAFNAEHASAAAQKIEIIDRLRSIDRRVRAAQALMSRDDDCVAESSHASSMNDESRDALAEWWHSAAVRETLRDDCDNGGDDNEFHLDQCLDLHGRVVIARVASVAMTSTSTSLGAKAEDSLATLRAMMGDDVVDDSGDIDPEACDRRQTMTLFEDGIDANVDENDGAGAKEEEENAEADGVSAEFSAAAKAKSDARDARRVAVRTEIRRLIQDASELTTTFDLRVRGLRDARQKVEFDILQCDAWRARLAGRLHDRVLAGDFNAHNAPRDGGTEENNKDEVHVKRAKVDAYASRVDASARALEAARRAVKTARRAFRRDVQDNPASRVHFDALMSLYETQSGISKHVHHDSTLATTKATRSAVFPQGLDDWWWDKLVSARAKRTALERDLRDAQTAYDATVARMRELELDVSGARERAIARNAALIEARRARWARAFDVECPMSTTRGYVEIHSRDAVRALERGDVVLTSKSKIDALNASLRAAYAAKLTAESANAATRDDIARAKWDIQTLDLQSQDITARTTEVALLRVSKRLQQFLFHNGGEGTTARRRGRIREAAVAASEAAARAERLHRNARLHEEKMSRKLAILCDARARENSLRARVRATRAEITRLTQE